MRTCRILALLLVVLTLIPLLFGCGVVNEPVATTTPAEETESIETEPPETTVEETEPAPPVFREYPILDANVYLKKLGRSRLYRGAIAVDWSGSGIEFEYEGSGDLEVVIERDAAKNVSMLAEVDGTSKVFSVDENGSKTYRIASDLPEGVHHVTIRRRTMVEDGAVGLLAQFKAIRLCGKFLQKPADKRYLVAFVGDSITCGIGAAKPDESYPAVLEKLLNR